MATLSLVSPLALAQATSSSGRSDGGGAVDYGPVPGEVFFPDAGGARGSGSGGGGVHPDTCESLTQACILPSDCCSGLGCAFAVEGPCSGPLCPTAQCCGENGAHECSGAGTCTDCCSQTSNSSGNCVCVATGSTCWDDDMCCSDSCSGHDGTAGTCQAAALQHACQAKTGCAGNQSSVDCRSGECCGIVDNPCSTNADCCAGNQCQGGVCLISLDQPWCTSYTECASNDCNLTTHDCCDALNQTCATSADCCPGNQCNGTDCKISDGYGWCSIDADCYAGHCDTSTHDCECNAPNGTCTGSGQSSCCSGEYCDGALCKTANGGSCSSNLTCGSDNCVSGICTCSPEYGACGVNADCCSNSCVSSHCS